MPTSPTLQFLVPHANAESFLTDFIAEHGPVQLLGRLLMAAEHEANRLGIALEFGTFEELVEVNKANIGSWTPLLPIYNPACSDINPDNSICIFGRNAQGEVVLTQVARYFDWTKTNFYQEATSLRLFYASPTQMSRPDEAVFCSAPSAHSISGRVAFTGALWCRPDYRGKGIPSITPRIARAIAIARWNIDTVCTVMTESTFARGVATRGAFPNAEWEVRLVNNPHGTARTALLWIDRPGIIADFEQYLADGRSEGIATK